MTEELLKMVSGEIMWRRLKESDDVLLLTHEMPDGDAVGSLFALYEALAAMGKRVRYLLDTPSGDLRFLLRPYKGELFEPKTVVTVDVADRTLLSDEWNAAYGDRVDLSIDHHSTDRMFARETLVEPQKAATALVLYDLFTANGVQITPYMAECLYTGIATDTGCFRYPNASAEAFRAAAALIDAGADVSRINNDVFETKSLAYATLESLAIQSLRIFRQGRIAVMQIPRAMLLRAGVTETEAKAINGLPRQIEGVLVGVTMKEREEGGWRVSIRSREPFNAAEVCKKFGGGGHPQAAGCELEMEADEAVLTIVSAIGEALDG